MLCIRGGEGDGGQSLAAAAEAESLIAGREYIALTCRLLALLDARDTERLKIGFVGAVVVSVIACAYGGYEFKWKEAIIESAVLVVVCWGAFVYGLGLPFRLFPWS